MVRQFLKVLLSLSFTASSAWGFTGPVRAIMEGIPATNSAILVSTTAASVTAGTGGFCYQSGQCQTSPTSASGTSSLAVTTGTVSAIGPVISSPTAVLNLSGADFTGQLKGGATAYIALNPNTTDFIHNQSTLQAQTTAYPQYLYVGSTATIPTLGVSTVNFAVDGSTLATGNVLTNILDNGGFEIWQRGITFNGIANNAYSADRWKFVSNGNGTINVTQDSTGADLDTGSFSLKVNMTSAGTTTSFYVDEKVENFLEYAGRTLTATARIKTSIPNVQLCVGDGIQAVCSTPHPGDGVFHTLSVTKNMSTSASSLDVDVGYVTDAVQVGVFVVDSVMLVVGSAPNAYTPVNPQVDLARCERYFEVLGSGTEYLGVGENSTTTSAAGPLRFHVPMRVAPTMTVNNPTNFVVTTANGSGQAINTLTTSQVNTTSFVWTAAASAANLVAGNATFLVQNATNATIYASSDF